MPFSGKGIPLMGRVRSPFPTKTLRSLFFCGIFLLCSCSRPPEEIPIGVIVTTGMELMERSTLNAVDLVEREFDQSGGLPVNGRRHRVRFHLESIDGGVPEQAVKAASRLINQKYVAAIIGPDFSSDAIPTAELVERLGIPLITPLSTHPDTTRGRKYVFRVSFTDDFQARAAAVFCLTDRRYRRFAVLYNLTNPYSRGLAEVFRETVVQGGGQITGFESYSSLKDGIGEQLARIKENDPDILYLPNYSTETEPVVMEARSMGIRATFFGAESWDRERFTGLPEMEGAFMTGHWAPEMPGENSREFTQSYLSRYGREPQDGAVMTYDALKLLMGAIQKAGRFDPSSIRDGLYALDDFQGITGRIDYVDSGDPSREGIILRFERGRVAVAARFPSK